MGNVRSEPGRHNTFAESEIKYWLSMDKKIYCFHMGNVGSEPSRQNTFAKSEIKSWLNMDKQMY